MYWRYTSVLSTYKNITRLGFINMAKLKRKQIIASPALLGLLLTGRYTSVENISSTGTIAPKKLFINCLFSSCGTLMMEKYIKNVAIHMNHVYTA